MVISCLVWTPSSCVRDTASPRASSLSFLISLWEKVQGCRGTWNQTMTVVGDWARTRTQKVRTIVPSPDTVLTASQECGRQLWASSELSSCMESSVHVVWRQHLGHPPWGEWILHCQEPGRRQAWKGELVSSFGDCISWLCSCLGCPWMYLWFWKVAKAKSQSALKPAAWCHRRSLCSTGRARLLRQVCRQDFLLTLALSGVTLIHGSSRINLLNLGPSLAWEGTGSCFWMSVLLGWLKDQRLEMIRVFFLPVGTWRHAFLGTAAYCLIPFAACAVGARGGTMWGFIHLQECSWLTGHKCCNCQGPESLQNYPKLKSSILSQAVSNLPCHSVSSTKPKQKCEAQYLCGLFSKHWFKDFTLGYVNVLFWKIVPFVPL